MPQLPADNPVVRQAALLDALQPGQDMMRSILDNAELLKARVQSLCCVRACDACVLCVDQCQHWTAGRHLTTPMSWRPLRRLRRILQRACPATSLELAWH